jgi:hypothetical protein
VPDVLVEANLVEEAEDGRYRFHYLVRLHMPYAAPSAETAADREAALRAVATWYARTVAAADQPITGDRLRLAPAPEQPGEPGGFPVGSPDKPGGPPVGSPDRAGGPPSALRERRSTGFKSVLRERRSTGFEASVATCSACLRSAHAAGWHNLVWQSAEALWAINDNRKHYAGLGRTCAKGAVRVCGPWPVLVRG